MDNFTPRKTLAEWLVANPGDPIQITILFTDIVGSTKLGNDIGDQKWLERLRQHFERGHSLIAQHDGYKIKLIGDSFMVAFRSPVKAIRFATAFFNDTGHTSIHIRACIHTGSARVSEDNDIYGRAINYASRILAWKKDAGVVLSEMAYDALISEYGEQRAKELFIQFREESIKDFPKTNSLRFEPGRMVGS